MKMAFAFVVLLGVFGSAQARIETSVTCGRVVSVDGAQVKMVVKDKTYIINKNSLSKKLVVPGDACVASSRLPASVGQPHGSALSFRPPIFRNAKPLNVDQMAHLRAERLQFKSTFKN